MRPPRAGRLASALMATLAAAGLASGGLTGCGRPPAPRSAAAQGKVVPSVSAEAFTTAFSVMHRLRALSELGTGKIGVLLPDTTSPRYTGRGKPLDGVLGGMVIAGIYNGIYLPGMSAAAQDLIFALVLLAAVSADVLARRGRPAAWPDQGRVPGFP
jgi:hypothetical protein